MAIDWQNFNIAADEMVQFMQPGASSIALNRILGSDASAIYGKLSANGQVFLSNPNGILFAPGASVNVDGLVATTMDIDPDKFMSGGKIEMARYGDGTSVVNKGDINTRSYAVFVADTVQNEGLIAVNGSRGGKAVFGNGENVTIDVAGDGLVSLSIDKTTVDSLIENKGIVKMTGAGDVLMTASGADEIVNNVINNEGIIEANSLGHITLNGANTIVNKGTGTISAKGGAIEINAAGTVEQRGTVTTASDKGVGGEIKISAVNKVELGGTVDASGKSGGGKIYIGGGSGGKGNEVNAKETIVAQDAQIKAGATSKGNGGNIVIWSDENTEYYGNISAQAGNLSGDGGNVEVAGKNKIVFEGKADLSSLKGKTGEIVLNAPKMEISAGKSISGDILSQLLEKSNVTITNKNFMLNYKKGSLDININDSLTYNGKNTLNINALNNVKFNNDAVWNWGGNSRLNVYSDYAKAGKGIIVFAKAQQLSLGDDATIHMYTHPVNYTEAIDYAESGYVIGKTSNAFTHNLVDNECDLQKINTNLKAKYTLSQNIDLAGATLFRPIGGNGYEEFTGEFDGQGFTLSNLVISGYREAGLFGSVNGKANIKNVGVIDANIKGSDRGNIGGLVGKMYGGKIENVYTTGLVDARGAFANAGGLVGYMVDGKSVKVIAQRMYMLVRESRRQAWV